MLEAWQSFYAWHDPTIFSLGFFQLRWYGLMYVTALLVGYYYGRWMVAKGHWEISLKQYESAFLWFVIGVVLGARLGYVLFYDPNTLYYLAHPWQIFNPVNNGEFVGISGLSYHGAIVGLFVALLLFTRKEKIKLWSMLDLTAVAGSAGYFFGRIGNFFNAELVGRETTVPWGVFYDGVLRHPSAIYEAFLEGFLVFLVLFFLYQKRKFTGQMALLYIMLYTTARFIAEFWRQPDSQLGFIAFEWLTMGQLLSAVMFLAALAYYKVREKNAQNR